MMLTYKRHFAVLLTTNLAILAVLIDALDRKQKKLEAKLVAASENDQTRLDERANLVQRITNFLGSSF